MEIEFVLGLSLPGTSRPGLVKMRGCMTLFEFGPLFFSFFPGYFLCAPFFSFSIFLCPFGLSMILFVAFSNGCFWWFYTNHVTHFPLVW